MQIELKNVNFSEALSEETNAFVAYIYVNGKKVAYAKNNGHGGSTFYHLHDIKHRDLLVQAEQYCLGLPPIKYETFEIPMNLENKIDELFEEWLKAKEQAKLDKKLQKDMLTGLCLKTTNGYTQGTWKSGSRKLTINELLSVKNGREALKNSITKAKEEGRVILNTNIPAEFFS